jgi:hypothetical protein
MRKLDTKHYSAEDWADYVKKQVPKGRLSAMKRHLDTKCKRCSAMVSLWTRVNDAASRPMLLEPPASAVTHVRNAFSVAAESKKLKREATIPRLSFDSLWQPAFAGVRSGFATSRHVTYASGHMSIDMHLEPEPKSERIDLAGQVSLPSSQDRSFPPIPVVVSGKTGSLATTTTNDFGEFHVAFVPEQGLQICFAIADKQIVIPLDSSGIRNR